MLPRRCAPVPHTSWQEFAVVDFIVKGVRDVAGFLAIAEDAVLAEFHDFRSREVKAESTSERTEQKKSEVPKGDSTARHTRHFGGGRGGWERTSPRKRRNCQSRYTGRRSTAAGRHERDGRPSCAA